RRGATDPALLQPRCAHITSKSMVCCLRYIARHPLSSISTRRAWTDTTPATALTSRVVLTVSVELVAPAATAFPTGASAVQVRAELDVSAAVLGTMVATLYLVSAATAPFTGRVADRRGARFSIAAGTSLSAMALAGLALFTHHVVPLVLFLACAG